MIHAPLGIFFFQVTVKGEIANSEPLFYVSGLRSGGSILDKATIRCIMEGASEPKMVEGTKEVLVFREVSKSG